MLDVNVKLVKDDLGKDAWRVPYIEYIFNQVPHVEPKLQAKVQRETWQFEVILDLAGPPQLYKKTTETTMDLAETTSLDTF